MGPNWSVPIRPRRNGELVSSSTSHDCPTDCIHVPMRETSCPIQKKRKSRCPRARTPAGRAMTRYTLPRNGWHELRLTRLEGNATVLRARVPPTTALDEEVGNADETVVPVPHRDPGRRRDGGGGAAP